ncbi:F-box protein At3g07870-like [Actinidia eriantha]|uniref:F-box protein At3g07870-like n=1 Tax=Actinidia eriantha TaxID=165200 RepID=UPI00258852D7|nr:F-box protein At3g07870-like [Actinidia eriantha]
MIIGIPQWIEFEDDHDHHHLQKLVMRCDLRVCYLFGQLLLVGSVNGFGFSSVSGQYKVVEGFQKPLSDPTMVLYECRGEVRRVLNQCAVLTWRRSYFSWSIPLLTLTKDYHILLHWDCWEVAYMYAIIVSDFVTEKVDGAWRSHFKELKVQTADIDEAIFICNPIVREYVTLPKPKYRRRSPELVYYGFGFSSVSGEYKVVQIFQRPLSDVDPYKYESQGEVYTLGTGKWRSIGTVPFLYVFRTYSVSLNGNVHWLIWDPDITESISSFDVDKEEFRLFPSPPGLTKNFQYRSLGLLEGRLCVCENNSDSDLVVWAMNEYGVKESWTKEFVIQKSSDLDWLSYDAVSPLKVWKNGDVLMSYRDDFLFSYSPERKTLEDVRVPSDKGYIASFAVYEMILHVASFVSLMDFEAERVYMF